MPTTIFVRVQWLMQTLAFITENDEIIFAIKQRICVILGLNPDLYCAIIRLNFKAIHLQDDRSLSDYKITNNARIICSLPRARISNIRRIRSIHESNSYLAAAARGRMSSSTISTSSETPVTHVITDISPLLSFDDDSQMAMDDEPEVTVEIEQKTAMIEAIDEKKEMDDDDCVSMMQLIGPPSLIGRKTSGQRKNCVCGGCQARDRFLYGRKSWGLMDEFPNDRSSILGFQMLSMMSSRVINAGMFEMDEDELLKRAIEASLEDQKKLESLKEKQKSEVEE